MEACLNYIILLWFIIFAAHYSDAVKYRCDYVYDRRTDGWFKLHLQPMTWKDARLMCTSERAILASPTSKDIRNVMLKGFRDGKIFTGLHATLTGKYFTIDGIPLDKIYYGWASHEPDNRNDKEKCIALTYDGYFTDEDCNIPLPFMCYKAKVGKVNICGTTDSEYYIDETTGRCYKFHTVPRTFSRANFVCAGEGGYLAIINSAQEAKALKALFKKYPKNTMIGKFWKDVAFMGFHNWDELIEWRTIHGQTLKEAGYDHFSPGEPNNATTGQYCGAIYRTALLTDLWCDRPHAFICEKDFQYPALCDNSNEDDDDNEDFVMTPIQVEDNSTQDISSQDKS